MFHLIFAVVLCEEVFKKCSQVHLIIILKHIPTLPHPPISLHVTTPAGFSQYLVFIVVSGCIKVNFYSDWTT